MYVHRVKHFGHHAAAQLMMRLQHTFYAWSPCRDALSLHALRVDFMLTHQLCAASSHRMPAALTK